MPFDLGQLPDLSADYSVDPSQAEAYQRDGHVLLRGVASKDEVAAYRTVIGDAFRSRQPATVPLEQRDSYHKAFVQIANLWEEDDAVARFVTARRFGKIAADLMGVDGVRLYHDQALFKEPGGGPTFWHQDQYYWPLDTPHTVTMWMPLVDVPVEMGALTFASTSHANGCVAQMAISEDSEQALDRIVKERRFPICCESMRAGDATFHSGWTMHCAPGNSTDRMREVMTVIYVADGVRIIEPDNPHRPADLARWFPGLAAGDVAASRINPLVYHRDESSRG